MKKLLFAVLLALVLPAWGPGSEIWAQTTQGEILGMVTDESGGSIPGAEVQVSSLETGFERRTVTDDQGFYSVPHLEPGRYAVAVEMPGFKRYLRQPLIVQPVVRLRVDVRLSIGEISEQVTVESDTPVIDTDSGNVADAVDGEHLRSIVMGGRGVFNWVQQTVGTASGNLGLIINGSRGTAGGHMIDGVSVKNGPDGNGVQSARPDQEALREVRVYSVNNSAEFAHQATIAQTTMSGSNEVHGQASYNHSNGALNARSFFAANRPRGLPIHNTFFSLGAPLVIPGVYDGRDRTFFFFHVEYLENSADNPLIRSVPTLAMRSGDFSALPVIKDPQTGQPFAGNQIPANRLVPSALKYMQRFYPLPAGPNANLPTPTSNFNVRNPGGRQDDAWNLRIDQNLSDKHSFFARYYQSEFDIQSGDLGAPPEVQRGVLFRVRTTRSAVFSSTYTFTPTTINESRLGLFRHMDPRHEILKGKDIVDLVGLTGFANPLDPEAFGFPSVTISGLTGVTPQNDIRNTQTQYHWVNNVTMIRGNHSFKFGGDFQHNNDSQFAASPTLQFGQFNFNGFATGHPFADFLLGVPRTAGVSRNIGAFHGSNTEWSLFVHNDWRLTPRLNLNLGLRYERHNPWTEQQDRIFSFDPVSGSIVVPTQAVISQIHPLFPATIPVRTAAEAGFPERSLMQTDTNDFAPRIGFAWRAPVAQLVLRGGYGVFYSFEANKGFRTMTGGPFVATETFDNAIVNGQPRWSWPQAFPAAAARPLGIQDLSVMAQDLVNSYGHQWNLTLERQFGSYGMRLSYIGTSTVQVPIFRNLNQPLPSTTPFNQSRRPYPNLRNIDYFDRGGSQQYNAFQAELTKRFTGGLSINSHYTWAKNLTNSHGFFGGALENAYDRARERGNMELPPHSFKAYFLWEVPVGRGRAALSSAHPLVQAVLGGWMLSGNFAANSGVFYTPFFTGRDISNTNVTSGRPDCVGDPHIPSDQRTLQREYNLAAFSIPAAGTGRFGNCGRGIIQGRGFWGANTGVFKYFEISDRMKFRLQGHIRNVLNQPKFGGRFGPQLNITAANAAHTTRLDIIGLNDIANAREIEVGVRLEW